MSRPNLSATALAHHFLTAALTEGAKAIDATAGNGHDTLFLCQQVGANGAVVAIDIQEDAIGSTERRLREGGLSERCQMIQGDHSQLASLVPSEWRGKTAAICFNLGYLPGAAKQLITTTKSVLQAIKAAQDLLAENGVLTVVAYPGHIGGDQEYEALIDHALQTPRSEFEVATFDSVNTSRPAPVLFVFHRRKNKKRAGSEDPALPKEK